MRPWLTTLAPILINFSRGLVSDHGSAALGIANVHDGRIHLIAL